VIGFLLYMSGIALFLFGAVAPFVVQSDAGREAERKGAIR
jgi:hypothetical protein